MRQALALLLLLPVMAWAAPGDGGIQGGGTARSVSGTTAGASTSVTVLPTNPNRIGCEIQAIGTVDMWVGIDANAANTPGNFYIPAGSLFLCPQPGVPTGRISVWFGSATQPYTAWEFAR